MTALGSAGGERHGTVVISTGQKVQDGITCIVIVVRDDAFSIIASRDGSYGIPPVGSVCAEQSVTVVVRIGVKMRISIVVFGIAR